MDLSDYLKSHLQIYHKNQGTQFGKTLDINIKSKKLKEQRKSIRHNFLSEKRLINENMSPYDTFSVLSKVQTKPSNQEIQSKKRLEMLKRWKEEKTKNLAQKKLQSKPPFKITHISLDIGLPNLENVNKVIKGKPIKTQKKTQKEVITSSKYDFAPDNYQFKGPFIGKPILKITSTPNKPIKRVLRRQNNIIIEDSMIGYVSPLNKKVKRVMINSNGFETLKQSPKVYKKTPAKIRHAKGIENCLLNKENVETDFKEYNLRSRKNSNTDYINPATKKEHNLNNNGTAENVKLKTKKIKNTKASETNTNLSSIPREYQTDRVINFSSSELSTDYPIEEYLDAAEHKSQPPKTPSTIKNSKTPNSKGTAIVYISPFVTISRGKDSARKEFHCRKSKGGIYDSSPDIEKNTGPKAGAAYFHRLLDQEIAKIQEQCDEWNSYKDTQTPSEEVCDMINVAMGQSQLLIQKKFKQFRDLINSCETGDSSMPITCEDLHGYWDTAYIQVENVNKRFDNLIKMRSNNWQEILPEKKKAIVKKAIVKKATVSKRKVGASSSLKNAIKAARNKAITKTNVLIKEEETNYASTNTFDAGFFTITSPKISNTVRLKPQNGSSRQNRKSQLVDNVLINEAQKRNRSPGLIMMKVSQRKKSLEKNSTCTPGKSILKTKLLKSNKDRPKSVLFKENVNNDEATKNQRSLTPEEDTPRMSLRRKSFRTKLF